MEESLRRYGVEYPDGQSHGALQKEANVMEEKDSVFEEEKACVLEEVKAPKSKEAVFVEEKAPISMEAPFINDFPPTIPPPRRDSDSSTPPPPPSSEELKMRRNRGDKMLISSSSPAPLLAKPLELIQNPEESMLSTLGKRLLRERRKARFWKKEAERLQLENQRLIKRLSELSSM